MPFEAKKTTLIAGELLTIEDAESLLEWLLKHPRGQLDLTACTHLHAANLQVLLAARPKIAAWPQHAPLATWLHTALN
ncbi:hypothetical protein [Chromatium okenii]|jgi:hypothetical protein|uniref:Uncharacterized protein n=1 Tax=Chromatium okenii TaxID=61644 RepID=A0A2S7XQS9_9GAMM|nr:hypothetical protein [Chromatium okenii]MBV5310924.1 hypothetical protein [Chromatium okenii]PQJ96080.1 hypothetical protein CXB77_09655 [Chromatium okenii]